MAEAKKRNPDITAVKELIEVMENLTDEETMMMLMVIKGYSAGVAVAADTKSA